MPRESKQESKSKSMGTKSQRRSARTIANVERRAITRAGRLERAVQRRLGGSSERTAQARRAQENRRGQQQEKIMGKRRSRERKRNFKPRRGLTSPTDAGSRQFGPRAKGYHVHQREHGLARALTPDEFQQLERKPKRTLSDKAERELERMDFHVATGGDLEA